MGYILGPEGGAKTCALGARVGDAGMVCPYLSGAHSMLRLREISPKSPWPWLWPQVRCFSEPGSHSCMPHPLSSAYTWEQGRNLILGEVQRGRLGPLPSSCLRAGLLQTQPWSAAMGLFLRIRKKMFQACWPATLTHRGQEVGITF